MYASFASTARRLAALLGLVLLVSLLSASVASAATYTVTTGADANNGACTPVLCTLRDAVIAADTAGGSNTISVPGGRYTLTIASAGPDNPSTGDLDITGTSQVAVRGAGASQTIIQVSSGDRAFAVDPGASLDLSGTTIQGGSPATTSTGSPDGGAIYSAGSLTLSRDVFSSNQSGALGSGGAVRQTGTGNISVNGSAFTANTAVGRGGAIADDGTGSLTLSGDSFGAETAVGGTVYGVNSAGQNGGAVYDASSSSASISDSGFFGNQATGAVSGDGGGALDLGSGTYALTADEFDANQAAEGGAVRLGTGTLTGSAVSFVGNTASASGGAIVSRSTQPLSLTNATVSNNVAGTGGGLAFLAAEPVSLLNDTLWENSGGGGNAISGAAGLTPGANGVLNTVIGTESSSGITGPSCDAALPSSGHNVGTDPTCFTAPPDAVAPSLTLFAPARNGGPVATDAEPSGAVTIDTGVGPPACPATDARGVTRPQGAGCDIGAYEVVAPPPTTTTTTQTSTVTTSGPSTTTTVTTPASATTNTVTTPGPSTTTTVTAAASSPPPGTPPSATTRGTLGVTPTAAFLGGIVDPHGIDTNYSFQVGTTSAYGLTTVSGHTDSGPLTLETRIGGLKPGTLYHYRLVAISAAGTARGADRTFRTASAYDGSVTLKGKTLTVRDGRVSLLLRCTSRQACRARVGLIVLITRPQTHTVRTLVFTRGSIPTVTIRPRRTATVSAPASAAAVALVTRATHHRLAGAALIRPLTPEPPASARVTFVLR